ncbi:MAG: hypothetical protein E7013_05575 [Alphaproteobacteria bacterium]|nr:hypothetical protein [Alphaproteobacteria bacterium]
MKKGLLLSLLALSMVGLSACSVRYTPVLHESNLQNVDLGSGRIRKGTACADTFLFFGPFGDNGIVKAAQNGRIRRVMIQEQRVENYFVFSRICTDVYGE